MLGEYGVGDTAVSDNGGSSRARQGAWLLLIAK